MSAFAVLSLQNEAAVAQTFNPVSIQDGVAKCLGTECVLDAKKSATMSVSLPKNGSSKVRIKQRIVVPIMDAVDTTKKIDEAYVNIEYALPKNSSPTVRRDIRKYADQMVINAVTTAAIDNFEGIY